MSEKTASWWADEVIRRMEADPNTDLAPVAVGQMITAQVFAEAIAAAEERGRRRGVEERDELRAALSRLLEALCIADSDVRTREVRAAVANGQAALAPRDSGKEGT